MSATKITHKLNNSYAVKNLNKFTIDGKLGKIVFYGKGLTLEQAQQKYNERVRAMDIFWEENRDTYFLDHPEDIKMTYWKE